MQSIQLKKSYLTECSFKSKMEDVEGGRWKSKGGSVDLLRQPPETSPPNHRVQSDKEIWGLSRNKSRLRMSSCMRTGTLIHTPVCLVYLVLATNSSSPFIQKFLSLSSFTKQTSRLCLPQAALHHVAFPPTKCSRFHPSMSASQALSATSNCKRQRDKGVDS